MKNVFSKKEYPLFTSYSPLSRKGFTFIEVLVIVAVTAVILSLSTGVFNKFNNNQALNNATRDTLSLLEEARSLTLASKNNDVYGVHFATNQVTRFRGNTYVTTSTDNYVIQLPSKISIENISLAGGGSDVIFKRLTGGTNYSGSVTLVVTNDAIASTTLTIHSTGLVE